MRISPFHLLTKDSRFPNRMLPYGIVLPSIVVVIQIRWFLISQIKAYTMMSD
jgi:cytosine/uracil/thiamine/allantoin permease